MRLILDPIASYLAGMLTGVLLMLGLFLFANWRDKRKQQD